MHEVDLLTVAHQHKQRREVLPMAILLQMTANINRDSQQRPYPYELDEVMEWLGYAPEAPPELPPRPTPEELYQKAEALQHLFPQNGTNRSEGEA